MVVLGYQITQRLQQGNFISTFGLPPFCLLIVYFLRCRLPVVRLYFHLEWKTVWILIRWLGQSPADRDLHCFKKKG